MLVSKVTLYKSFPFLLVLFVLAVFFPVLNHQFLLEWDDKWQVLHEQTFRGLRWYNILEIFSTFYNGQYSPLDQFFYSALYACFGESPIAFHTANLLWHIGFVLLTYFFVKKILELILGNISPEIYLTAFITALLAGIHPIQAESVAWISASKILTCCFFFMASLVSYLVYIQKGKTIHYVFSMLFFACSFLCKEQAVILPFCLLLIDYITGRKLWSWQLAVEKLPFFALMICFAMVTAMSFDQSVDEVILREDTYPFLYRVAFAGYSLQEYILKLLFPINLMYIYPFPMKVGEDLPMEYYFYPLVIIVLLAILWHYRKNKIVLFGGIFFLLNLSLYLHIIPLPRFAITADRYLYIACIGLFLPLVYYGVCYLRKKKNTLIGKSLIVLSFLCIVYFGVYAHQRCQVWHDSASLKKEIRELLDLREADQ